MNREKTPWFMRLTLVNKETGQTAFAMYPEDKYSLLESLDCCQLPYGSGEYRHLAESPNGIHSDGLLSELAGVIENEAHPPSIQELNYLAGQIQRMTEAQRAALGRRISGDPEAAIAEAINAAHRLLGQEPVYDGRSMTDRAVLLGEDEPYIRVRIAPGDDEQEQGVWVDCPAQERDLAAAAEKLGTESVLALEANEWAGLLAFSDIPLNENISPFVNFGEIDRLACAMMEHGVLRELGKFKALLQVESCSDFGEAAKLAGELDQYEFYRQAEFDLRCQIAGLEMDRDEAARELELEETDYGLIRPAGEQKLEQQLRALRWGELAESPNPLLELASQLYEWTDGLCEAGPGPGGVGVSTGGGSKVHLLLSFDPDPVQGQIVFPKEIGQYQVRVTGFWDKSRELVRQEEMKALLDDADPATQKVAGALWELGRETREVSTEEFHEAFDVLAKWEMRDAYGTPDGTPPARQMDAEEPESGPTLCQL